MEPVKSRTATRRTKAGTEQHIRFEQDPRGPWYPLVRSVVEVKAAEPRPIVVIPTAAQRAARVLIDADPAVCPIPKTAAALVARLRQDDGAIWRLTYSLAMVPPSKVSKTGDWTRTHVHCLRVRRADGGAGWAAWCNGSFDAAQWVALGDVWPRNVGAGEFGNAACPVLDSPIARPALVAVG